MNYPERMSAVHRSRNGLFLPGLVLVSLGMLGIIVSYVMLFGASPHDSEDVWDSTSDTAGILLMVAMFATAFGADALLVRLSLFGWAQPEGRPRVFSIIGVCLAIVGAEIVCSFGTGSIFFFQELSSSCHRFGC
jgi:hypothetical protein